MTERLVDGIENEGKSQPISYNEFKNKSQETINKGHFVIDGFHPAKLWASQDWVDAEKVTRTTTQGLNGEELTLPAYYKDLPTGQRAIILGNGHHHALRAWERSERVKIEIIGAFPEGNNFMSFSRFRRETGQVFRDL
jgi:hypothetical protein